MDTATGQIIPDNSLGSESSVVKLNANTDLIDGGARRGANLFHSFQEFNVGQEGKAYFSNPAGIDNILSRVTGGKPSNIFGTLGVEDGNANLFFINPNGIFFGPDARLDMRGSFLASTANSLLFDSGLEFSTTNPQVPPMLAINIPIGLRFRDNPGSITNQSVADGVGLQVSPGKSLSLVGGDISLDRGRLTVAGGQVNLGGLAGKGIVGFNSDGSLSFPDGVTRSDVSLSNGAHLDTSTSRQGDAGNVVINADTVSFDESSAFSRVEKTGEGNGGNINITTENLSVTNGARLDSSTLGQGNAGSITINASETVSFDGTSSNRPSLALSGVAPKAQGNGKTIEITTGSLSVTNGAQLDSSTFGQGNAGNVNINARDTVSFDGFHNQIILAPSAVFTKVESGAVGQGGDINITAESLFMTNGAQLLANTSGKGNAGDVNINARDIVSLDGVGSNKLSSAVFSSITAGGVGQGGNIYIKSRALFITNGASLATSNTGQGNAGDVKIYTESIVSLDGVGSNGYPSAVFGSVAEDPSGSLEKPRGNGGHIDITTGLLTVTNGARLAASTIVGWGNAGSITINSREASFDGVGSRGPSGAFSAVGSQSVGNGVGLNITTTESLSVKNGAVLSTSTRGQGDGGNIKLNASTLEVVNGGQVITTSFGSGKAGNITLNTSDSIILAGNDPTFFDRLAQFRRDAEDVVIGVGPASGLFANTEVGSTGNGGNISIYPKILTVRDGATITVNSDGEGIGGNIQLSGDSVSLDGGAISAKTRSNNGGNVNLHLQDLLLLRNSSQITTDAGEKQFGGNGGNIKIDVPNGFIVALPSENSDITANAYSGRGGNIYIKAKSIFGIERRIFPTLLNSDITASSELGIAGDVTLNIPNVDPRSGLVELKRNVVDPSEQIAQNPCQRGVGSKFIITGRGGLPPSPNEATSSDAVRVDLVEPAPGRSGEQRGRGTEEKTKSSVAKPIVPTQGWIFDKNGEVMLTAYDPTGTGSQRPLSLDSCPVP
ncbi:MULTISPECIES: two-partner secretion domain-containing protein [Nostoc]|nr:MULTISPECIES: filamentous hemagglutinin N-terminal domain-containing protein [Nostoc]